jgi:rhamnose transport system ATP-binding protein
MPVVLSLEHIVKSFPGVRALDDVRFEVKAGEVHALLGENGAGKSTLIKIVSGLYQPDAGTMRLDGEAVRFTSPHDAQGAGIATIFQELLLFPELSVAENIFMGHAPRTRLGTLDWAAMRAEAQDLLASLDIHDLDVTRIVGSLSVGNRQRVEIAKALSQNARILIMDEPTAALTEAETGRLFAVIRGLTARGVAVVYISHRMPEIFAIGDRVTVMRDGATVDTRAVAGTTVEALIAAMVGRPLAEQIPKRSVKLGEPRLQVIGLRQGPGVALGPVSFEVRAGEIFGLAGLMGSGRTEVARAIFGADRPSGGEVRVAGRRLDGTVRGAIAAGVGLVTEDRKAQGLVLDCTAAENITLAVLGRLTRLGLLDLPGERRLAEGFRERMRIRLHSIEQRVRTLSGGNQQKVVMARWLATDCQVLILDEPTRGVDVGAKAEIYELIGELAGRGVAVLLISSELPEVLGLCDRIGVMRERRLAGILPRDQATQERVMALAVGGAAGES